jgi:phosphoglycerol transferase
MSKRARSDLLAALALTVLITVGWAGNLRLFQDQRLSDPLSYWSDAHFIGAVVAASARGEYSPFASKTVPSLGAPFIANWNDFPLSDDWLFFLTGQAARVLGTFGAINLGYLLGCVLAGLSLFVVSRRLHRPRDFSLMAGLLYGLTTYAFYRGVHHYTLLYYWVLPWAVLVSFWAASRAGIPLKSGRFRFGALVFLIVGWSSPYYLFFFLQLFGLSFLSHLGRRGRRAHLLGPLLLVLVGGLSFLSVNLDSIAFTWAHGPNREAVGRSAQDGELYALKPINLFIPGNNHRFAFMKKLAEQRDAASIATGEVPGPYLGFAGAVMLLWLLVHAALAAGRRRIDFGLSCALIVAWFLIGHSVGGENSLLAVFGFKLFRSVNRASIMIFAVVLLFATWGLPRLLRRLPPLARWVVALLIGVGGAFEAAPVVADAASVASDRRLAESDRALVAKAEAALPVGAKVFQLPPMHFPEVGPSGGVGSYELFRPYFFSKTLTFSHGDIKGRPNADWKFRVAALPVDQMVKELKSNGFSAIYVNTKGYGDTSSLVTAFSQQGVTVIAVADANDSVFLKL